MSYRQSAKATPWTLEQLAREARDCTPSQSHLLADGEVTKRLEMAVDVHQDHGSFLIISAVCWLLVIGSAVALFGGKHARPTADAVTFFALLTFFTLVATFSMVLSYACARDRRAAAITRELAWAEEQPFTVVGYREWLVGSRSILTIVTQSDVDRTMFSNAVRAIDPLIEAQALDDCTFTLHLPSRRYGTTPFGNVPLLKATFDSCSRFTPRSVSRASRWAARPNAARGGRSRHPRRARAASGSRTCAAAA